MFTEKKSALQVQHLSPCHVWAASCSAGNVGEEVAERMHAAEAAVPQLGAWRTTPQSAPWHAEGPVVADHIARILTVLFAVVEGADPGMIEEFAREKDLREDIAALTKVLRAHPRVLTAFALVHDMAKPDVVYADAARDTKGAAEGFVQHAARSGRTMTEAERTRYFKLFRAYSVRYPTRSVAECMGGFFDAYGIRVHFDEHETHAASPAYAPQREAVYASLGLTSSEGKMCTTLVRYHIPTIAAFTHGGDRTAYKTLAARGGKAGLNVDLFLDLAFATLFLDAVAGSLVYEGGSFRAHTELIVHMLRAERDAFPKRHEARVLAAQQEEKQAYKTVLAEAGLDGESVFALLHTPLGPVRGEVMRRVQEVIVDPSAPCDFGVHTDEIRRRAQEVARRLSSR